MKKILIPTDFSSTALKAAGYAAEMAQKNGAILYMMHVLVPHEDSGIEVLTQDTSSESTGLQKRVNELDSIQKTIRENYPDLKIETTVARGTVTNAIRSFSEEQNIDLVVMGTTGASGLQQTFMGSVAAGLMGKIHIPVLTVPASYEVQPPATILFATNHFEEDDKVLQPLIQMATLFGANILVTKFLDVDHANAVDYLESTRSLDHYIDKLHKRFPGINFASELLEGHKFEATIEKFEAEEGIDMIVMITHHRGFFESFFNRSMTKKIAFHATIPLLAIPST